MTVKFINGSEILISQDIANILRDRIIEGCKDFQIFSDQNGNLILIINIKEICSIG